MNNDLPRELRDLPPAESFPDAHHTGMGISIRDALAPRGGDPLRLLELALERIDDIVMIATADMTGDGPVVVYVNEAFVRRTGYSRAEAIGSTAALMQGQATEVATLQRIAATLSAGQPVQAELVKYTRSGVPLLLELDIQLLTTADGRCTHLVEFARDITAPRRAAALMAGQTRILERVAHGDPLTDVLNDIAVLAEQQAPGWLTSILLLDDDGLHVRHGAAPHLPRAYTQAIDGVAIGPDTGSCGTAAWRRARVVVDDIATDPLWRDYRDLAAAHGLAACWSTPVLSRDGKVVGTFAYYASTPRHATEIELAGADVLVGLVAIAVEHERARQSLLGMRNRLLDAQHLARLGVWSVTFEPEQREWSEELFRIFGLDVSAPTSYETFIDMVHPDDRAHLEAAQRRSLAGAGALQYEYRIRAADGRLRYVEERCEATFDVAGVARGLAGTTQDITERRVAELRLREALAELQRSNRELQDFAFVASHDLQEPLRKIRTFAQYINELPASGAEAKRADFFQRMQNAAERMQHLLRDLLSYSQVSNTRAFTRVALDDVVGAVLGDLDARIEATGARIEVEPLPVIEGDAPQLQQVILNLLSNALKFRRAGVAPHVRISVALARLADVDVVRMSVADNGIGIDPAYRQKIFAPFQRLHGRAQYEGSGMGLAIVRKIIDLHGGRIDVETSPEGGSAFIVTLPLVAAGPSSVHNAGIVRTGMTN